MFGVAANVRQFLASSMDEWKTELTSCGQTLGVVEGSSREHRALVAQLVEHLAVTREVVSSTPAGPTLRVFK